MTYDFDKIVERRGTSCVKWDEMPAADVLPLWVADMDFEAAPAIKEALRRRVEQGVFGYSIVPEAYYDACIRWFKQRHGWEIRREWIQYTTGVVPAISCILKALTMPGQKVLLTTPVYNCFFSCVRNNGCMVEESPLIVREDGKYAIDWDDFERRCQDEKVVAYVLCNPQNPGGRVWAREELEKVAAICERHGVTVISDEIHNEIVMPGFEYVPFATVSDWAQQHCVVCTSASKSFNIAGLQIANIICADPALSLRIDRAININEVCDTNPFGFVATIAAYNECGDWMDQLCLYIQKNHQLLQDRIQAEGGGMMRCMPLEGTYLAWVDCTPLCKKLGVSSDQLQELLVEKARVYFSSGTLYGTDGEGYLRINLACPQSVLNEALNRFIDFIR